MFLFHAAASEFDLLPAGCHYEDTLGNQKIMGFSALTDRLTLAVGLKDTQLLFQSSNASYENFNVTFSRKTWGNLRLYTLYEELILSHMVCPVGFCSGLFEFCQRKKLSGQIPDYCALSILRIPNKRAEIEKRVEELSDLYKRVSDVQNVVFGYINENTLPRFKLRDRMFKVLIDFFGITYCQIVLEYMVLGNKLGTQVDLIEKYIRDLGAFYDLLSGKLYSIKFHHAAPYQICDIVGTIGDKGNFFVLSFLNQHEIKTSLLLSDSPETAHAVAMLRLLFLKGIDGIFSEAKEHIAGLMDQNRIYSQQFKDPIKKEASVMLDMMLFLLARYFAQQDGSAIGAAQQIQGLLTELLAMEQTDNQEMLSEEEKLAQEIEAQELTKELEDVKNNPSSFFLNFVADIVSFFHYIKDKNPNIMVINYITVCLKRYSIFFDPAMEAMFIHDREKHNRSSIEKSCQTRWNKLWEEFSKKKDTLAMQELIHKEQQERALMERKEKAIRTLGQKHMHIRWDESAERHAIETGALRRLAKDAHWCAYLALVKEEKRQRLHITERENLIRLRSLEPSGLWWEQKKQRYSREKASLDWLTHAHHGWSSFAAVLNEGYQQAERLRAAFDQTIQEQGSIVAAMHYLYQGPSGGLWADEMDEADPI